MRSDPVANVAVLKARLHLLVTAHLVMTRLVMTHLDLSALSLPAAMALCDGGT
jgi:hypothetical protein